MTIQLEAPTSRYTTTQTQTQRRAPLGSFGDAFDDLQNQWTVLGAKFYKLTGVDPSTSKAFDALIEKFGTWADASAAKNSRAVTQDQLDGLAQAQKLYNAAVAAGAKITNTMVKTGTGKTTVLAPEYLAGATGIVAVILGLAALLFVLPERKSSPGLTSIDMFPNTRRRRGRGFGALKVGQEVRPVRFTKAPAGNTFVTVAPDRVGRVVEVKRVGRGKNAVTRHFVEWRSMGRGAPAVSGWYDEEALTVE